MSSLLSLILIINSFRYILTVYYTPNTHGLATFLPKNSAKQTKFAPPGEKNASGGRIL